MQFYLETRQLGDFPGGNGGNMKGSSISDGAEFCTISGGNGGNMKGSSIALSRFLRNPLVVILVI